jgi:uncharacterized protein (TIGR03435 family)
VVDRTGLTGRYDFSLEYTVDAASAGTPGDIAVASDPGSNVNSAVEEQLGLKLTKSREKLDVIVIDRVARTPTEN